MPLRRVRPTLPATSMSGARAANRRDGRSLRLSLVAALIAVSAALAGCALPTPAARVEAPRQQTGLALALHDVTPLSNLTVGDALLEHMRIKAPDNVALDTWIVRPAVAHTVPLVLTVTPYHSGGSPISDGLLSSRSLGRLGDTLLAAGYAVGVSSVRGTGQSGGCFTIGGAQEAKDTAAVIEHLAGMGWSDGSVGLIGVSYDGTTAQDAWLEAPPALKSIVPISAISDFYRYNFVNGVPVRIQGYAFNTYYWAQVGLAPFPLGLGAVAPGDLDSAAVPGMVVGEACLDQAFVQEGGVSSTIDGNKDEYWQERDLVAAILESPRTPRAAVFYVHGLQDWNVKPDHLDGWLEALQASGVPFKAWLGQWDHSWPEPTQGPCPRGASCRNDFWEEALVAWFDQTLKGIDTGILDTPPIQVQDDDGVWRHETKWPPATEHRWFHPQSDGRLGDDPVAGRMAFDDERGQPLQAAGDPGSAGLIWKSAPLPEDWHIAGRPSFQADVTASGHRASLILTLAEQMPDGSLRPINFAAQSLNHVTSLEDGDPSIAGVTQRVVVDFFPQDDVVHAGNRLVLVAAGNVVGAPGPALQPVADGSIIAIDLLSARLSLPVDVTIVAEEPQPFD